MSSRFEVVVAAGAGSVGSREGELRAVDGEPAGLKWMESSELWDIFVRGL